MNKKILFLISIVVLIAVIGIGYYFSLDNEPAPTDTIVSELGDLEKISDTADKIKDSATKGVLPSIQTNPLEGKPDLNPADKANPYNDIKINPFE